MKYTQESLSIDEEWLREWGVDTEEVTGFIIGLVTRGFEMTRKEYVELIKEE